MRKPASVFKRSFGIVFASFLALSWFSPTQRTLRELPEQLRLTQGQIRTFQPGALALSGEGLAVNASQDERLAAAGAVEVTSDAAGTSELLLSLFGIPLRRVEVEVSPEKRLIPGGQALGVAMHTQGVLVVGTSEVADGVDPARNAGIRAGDVLLSVGNETLRSADDLSNLIAKAEEQPLTLALLRGGKTLQTTIVPKKDAATGTSRIGAWVRDSTAGVGTLSFYDPDTGAYAALGHAITDGDTGSVLSVSRGQILKANIVAVQKGQRGAPGELKGSFLREGLVLGDIRKNTILGIYGHMTEKAVNPLYPNGVPIGLRSGVHTGAASILSSVDGQGVQEYAVEITRVNPQSAPAPKSMVLRVTDERLLAATGGIVQGMSGSPILQDGRLIGAVTHVCVRR